jgi:hypothetical protein
MNHLEREFRERVFTYFRPYTVVATSALKEILSSRFPDDVVFLDFAMFPYDRLGDHLPIFTWPTTLENAAYSFECPLSKIPTKEFAYYDEEIEDFVEMAWHLRDCAARWLRGAWREAGGELYRLPCFFTEHDRLESFSFRQEQWVDNDPKTKRDG